MVCQWMVRNGLYNQILGVPLRFRVDRLWLFSHIAGGSADHRAGRAPHVLHSPRLRHPRRVQLD